MAGAASADRATAFPERLKALLGPGAYPHPVERVELIETHVSWVLLTGELAYKIKRPVRYPFVDQSVLERRTFLCQEEVRLNRRFAPQLYLGLSTIREVDGQARLDPARGEVIEWAVRMRQFRREEELDRLLLAGRIEPEALEAFGRDLAMIHAGLPVAAAGEAPDACGLLLENLAECTQAARLLGRADDVAALKDPLQARLAALAPVMSGRLAAGRVRECHGDLHSRNIVRQGTHLVAFDCLEFAPALRLIDVADEMAFLLMDLDAQSCPLHAQAFLGGYLAHSGDYQACRVLDLYKAHRALVRAKVAALSAAGAPAEKSTDWQRQLERYVACARQALKPRRPRLILMSGLSGSGKTWVARRLAPMLGAVHLRSDLERKRLAGLPERACSGSRLEADLYSREASTRVYERLARCAGDVLAGGYTVIVDATFQRREQRAAFRSIAAEHPALIIHCHAPPDVLEQRILKRRAAGTDASEADLAVLHWQQAQVEPTGPDEGFAVMDVATTGDRAIDELARQLHGH